MLRIAARFLAAVFALSLAGGASIATAAAAPAQAARHGTERLVFMGTSTQTDTLSVLATGLFTDGGRILLGETRSTIRLGHGTFWFRDKDQPGHHRRVPGTCLTTITDRGTYRLSHGTGQYAGIRGTGRFLTTGRVLYRRAASGRCESGPPRVAQLIITLHGPVTLGR